MGKQSTKKQLKKKRERTRRNSSNNAIRHSERRILTELKNHIDDRVKAYAKYDDHSKLYSYWKEALALAVTPGVALPTLPAESALLYPVAFIFSFCILYSGFCGYHSLKNKRPEIEDYLKNDSTHDLDINKWQKS